MTQLLRREPRALKLRKWKYFWRQNTRGNIDEEGGGCLKMGGGCNIAIGKVKRLSGR